MTQTVKLAKLKQSEKNVRTTQPKNIPAMAASIRARGIIQNLLVTPSKPRGMFEVIAGERRYLGAMMLAEAGEIVEVPVASGDKVSAGDVLVRTDDKDLQAVKAHANAAGKNCTTCHDPHNDQFGKFRLPPGGSAEARPQP